MPLKQPWAVKQVITNTELELRADPGEAFMVWDIYTYDPVSDYVTVKIDKSTVGYFRVRSDLGGHQVGLRGRQPHTHNIRLEGDGSYAVIQDWSIMLGDNVRSIGKIGVSDITHVGEMYDLKDATREHKGPRLDTLLGLLRAKGHWTGFPVAEGETFRLEGAKNPNGRQIIIYSIYDPADISPDMPNGSKSKDYLFINYGNCGASIQATADNLYNTAKNPAEFPDFPFGNVCPAKHEIDLIGICGSPFAPRQNDDTDYSYTQFLKLVKDREVLFDEDRNGIIFEQRNLNLASRRHGIAEGISLIGNYSEFDKQEPLFFDPPISFVSGDELNIYVSLVVGGSGQAIDIYQHEIALIERVRRVD
uniref:Uncharacterized protein n=1 Tax=viral metagenome TaxID=1070528 RepID=A0A6M3LDS4_9ZZZZ